MLQIAREGFNRKIWNIRAAQEHAQRLLDGVDIKSLSGKKAPRQAFHLAGGSLEMNKAQIMELYELNKREQAKGHMLGDGISLEDKTHKVVHVTAQEIAEITDTLTKAEKNIADELQRFMAKTIGGWGNEASMELYGYKKFGEPDYYPIRSNQNRVSSKESEGEKSSFYALENKGMTKATVSGANNAILIGDIFATFTRHAEDMANYNAYVGPIRDIVGWYNYKARSESSGGVTNSTKQEMERVFGKGASRWLDTFLRDLNGSTEGRYGSGIFAYLSRSAKVAAVGANLRVVIQQLTAYARAFAEIDGKYLLKGLVGKPKIALSKKYSLIAQWKSWGYFETGLGKSMRETIVGDQSAMEWIREKSTALAGVADEVTWGYLWNAVAAETKDTHPELTPGTEEFCQAVGNRLSEVIDKTQVVDSVSHRTHIMRSKDGLTQLATAFMSEPMKSYNMARTAIADVARNPKDAKARARLGRVMLTFTLNGVLTSAAAAVMDAFRNNDDDKDWWEKYQEAVLENVVDNLNPLNMIPIARDIVSLAQGYQPNRMDLQGVTRAMGAIQQWEKKWNGEGKWSDYRLIYETVWATSDLTGIPAGSLMRELQTIWQTVTGKEIPMGHETASTTLAAQNLYTAILRGDTHKIDRIRGKLQGGEKPKSNKEIDDAVADVLMESDPRIAQAYAAREESNVKELRALRGAVMQDGFTGEMFDSAVNKYHAAVGKAAEEADEKDLEKQLSANLYSGQDLVKAARNAAKTGKYEALDDILAELIADSKTKDPERDVRENGRKALKEEYIAAFIRGDKESARRLGTVLKSRLGATDKSLEKWVYDDRRERLVTAIDGGKVNEANAMIYQLQEGGKTEADIGDNLRTTYRSLMREAKDAGNETEIFKLTQTLLTLDLYVKGKPFFTQEMIDGWLKTKETP